MPERVSFGWTWWARGGSGVGVGVSVGVAVGVAVAAGVAVRVGVTVGVGDGNIWGNRSGPRSQYAVPRTSNATAKAATQNPQWEWRTGATDG
jgi:hypothetical protein